MRCLIIAIVLTLAAPSFEAQVFQTPAQITAQWHWYAQTGDNLISDIRPKFRKVLDPEDEALESSLEYEIIITGNINAFAARGGRTILTAGLLQIIDSMATVMSAAQQYNKPECLGSYIDYIAQATQNNNWLVMHNQQPMACLLYTSRCV